MTIITEQEFFQGYPPEKVYITSDLHLYHKNIIEYCNRPFDDCLKMTEFLLEKFSELPEDCLIWNFGDVFLNWNIEHSQIMNDIMRMKKSRRMCLILGNHDFQSNKKPFKNYIEFFKYLGFDEVYKGPLQMGNYIFSHEPVFISEKDDFINFHGHTHNKNVTEDYFLGEYNKKYPKQKVNPAKYKNVCMDANNFNILNYTDL
ncbi:MAG: metallophosphoesterase family protein [Treponema sp.]|nr:metallophosphoesterase family protein [Candidatus Treponema equifaecale]